MMINRCPATNKTATQSSRPNCIRNDDNRTDISDQIPVTGDDGKTYRNAFYAKCHGVNNITYWGLAVECPDPVRKGTNLEYGSDYLNENCTWYISPGDESVVPASPCKQSTLCESVVSTAESSHYTDLINKCEAYSQLVTADNSLYKNFHCASCNGKEVMKFGKFVPNVKRPSLMLFFDYKSISRGPDHKKAENKKIRESNDDVIQSYLTLIGLPLSITSLLAVVITYAYFSTLRTLPGLVLAALSLSLLAYQTLLLVSFRVTSGTVGCKVVAILLHLLTLMSFSWMTVMSYDVYTTFSRKGTAT